MLPSNSQQLGVVKFDILTEASSEILDCGVFTAFSMYISCHKVNRALGNKQEVPLLLSFHYGHVMFEA